MTTRSRTCSTICLFPPHRLSYSGLSCSWCTMTTHWFYEPISLLIALFCPGTWLVLTLPHGSVQFPAWWTAVGRSWPPPESREFSPGWQEQLAEPRCPMLRHAWHVHLRISSSVSSWAAVPASCKLSGNCVSGNWCEIRSSRMKPLPFLCLISFLVFELVCSLPVQDPHPVSTHLSPNTLHLASSFYHWAFFNSLSLPPRGLPSSPI